MKGSSKGVGDGLDALRYLRAHPPQEARPEQQGSRSSSRKGSSKGIGDCK